ncbi:ras GTPase-activating protein nGAP-like isoform X2 [Uloborus diversus]|uniref:ras GTPase-activating protein nGAP-like isoform X2 n=1 Tax=Uloborus diversus TaxID=327109 RepID=UPI00240A797B|nr:ras GTPase-activating protein nGAP-like isoform X2 [Uloborus diversus]
MAYEKSSESFLSKLFLLSPRIPRARLKKWRNQKSIGERLFLELPRVRLDGGRQAFRRRWGYDIGVPSVPEEDEDSSELSETTSLRDERLLRFSSIETSYEKACSDRRGSAPATPVLGIRTMDTTTPSRFANFFSKRSFKSNPLKRTKSVTKLERKRCTIDGDSVTPSMLRTSRSHESLLQSSPGVLATLDLSHGDVQVAALHSSLIGQENCFQMISNGGTRFYTCRTKEERDQWLYSLRRTIQPNQDNVRRKENSLKIWIMEAKGMSAKKSKYYCELCLDKTLYARTSSKQKGEMCFWGEYFEFNSLPTVGSIFVNLYREADKKKRRDKNVLIGCVHISVSSINGKHYIEKWYTVATEKGANGKECPSMRIKSCFQTIEVLPLIVYKDLLQYVKTDYKTLCEMLEPAISVRAKDDVATTLINIMQKENLAKEFLAELVMSDIEKIGDLHLTFRGNSLATKATEAYMKLLGDKYLQDTLGTFLRVVLESSDDCEVDPTKATNNATLLRQQANLMTFVEMVWVKIINSASNFPHELREVFHECRKRLTAAGKEELCDNLISASIFLRFLCPAILSPSLFNLSQEYPQGKSARNLTLVAKTIQTLANFTRFGGKESFMEFMNGFVEREWSTMKAFLRQISSPPTKEFNKRNEFDGYIDIGKELAGLHNLLTENLPRVNQKCYYDHIDTLQQILNGISSALSRTFVPKNVLTPSAGTSNQQTDHNSNSINNENLTLKASDHCSLKTIQREIVQSYVINARTRNTEDYHSLTTVNSKVSTPVTPFNRPSTLPRNAYLLGSGRKAASDLTTSDDYVLCSAFDADQGLVTDGTAMELESLVPKKDSVSPRLTKSCIYGEIKRNEEYSPYQRLKTSPHNEQKLGESHRTIAPQNGVGLQMSLVNGNEPKISPQNKDKKEPKRSVQCNGLSSDDAANTSGEMEVSNHKGSQISISQLSNVASSGYQSFPYSQSSSPVDPELQHDNVKSQSAIVNGHTPPLAFNNPMYHFPSSNSTGQWDRCNRQMRKHFRKSHLSSFSSLSAEDISVFGPTSLANADSSLTLSVEGCNCPSSSSSSGTASCNSTPPRERRNSQFKSTAPRTNPRYSGAGTQHSCCSATIACSPRLATRALSHPTRSLHHHYHHKQCILTASYFQRKQKNLNLTLASNTKEDSKSHDDADIENSNIQSITPVVMNESENKKRVEDYEKEVEELKQAMADMQSKLTDAEEKLIKQESVTERFVADWQVRLEAGKEEIRRQQEEKDQQMKNIITRLITVEEELRREQQDLQGVIFAKQKVIDAQERKIQTLDAANNRLLAALAQLKERYQLQGRNGTISSSPTSPARLAVIENGDVRFQSSSC